MKINKLIKKADIIIIALLLLTCILLLIIRNSEGDVTAEISIDGVTEYIIELQNVEKPYTADLGNGITVAVDKNGVSVLSSDCYGKNCINCGKLSKVGDMAVCIPNKTVIRLTGTDKNRPDAVTY